MKINYNNRRFRPIQNTENGETSAETIFIYQQAGGIVTSEYSGGEIIKGSLIAKVNDKGELDMRYQQINTKGEFMTGICHSTPEILPDGRIRLHEKWQWTSGDKSSGESILEELA
ncbi:n-acetylglutamate synthase [Jiulongibacter sp. NS-SX5]|uniref:n-acetylglutamate synthase n=1 Tax=Jiulongibacter sp. NS-SX5 TaxID=3463854 RepID=UPI00405915EB